MNRSKNYLCLAALLAMGFSARAAETILFQDNFDVPSGDNWTVLGESDTGTPDHEANFAFDYSASTFELNGIRQNVPPAPSSNGTTLGLRLRVNKLDDFEDRAAINVYPTGQSFSGDFALRFDMFLSYNGPAGGGTGSTEHALFGLNHAGDKVNWDAPGAISSDGVWFGVDGEAGTGNPPDYLSYEGEPGFPPIRQEEAAGGFLDRNGNGVHDDEYPEDTDPINSEFGIIFPNPPFESTGGPGKQWVQVEIRQQGGVVTWLINGYVIAEKTQTIGQPTGNIMLGLMDIFPSIPPAEQREDTYVLFDNLRVVNLTGEPARPRLSISSLRPATEPSTSGAFLLSRAGDTSSALTVPLRVSGNATPDEDYTALPPTVTIPAGAASIEIPVAIINDNFGEEAEEVRVLFLGSGWDYEVFAPMSASVAVADDTDTVTVSVEVTDAHSYEPFADDPAVFTVRRLGDTTSELRVNFTLGGTAQAGTDYQAVGGNVVIPAGADSAQVTIVPNDNNAVSENRTVTFTLAAGPGYAVGSANTGTATIRNDDLAPGELVFSDNFNTDTFAEWSVNMANFDLSAATFNWNYGDLGIPPAPNSTDNSTLGLKLEANISTPTFTGISVSPLDKSFTGDFRLSFDMWINFPGPFPGGGTGSTMMFTAGVGTHGFNAQFPGTSVEGVLFAVSGDGGTTIDYRAYTATGAPLAGASGVYSAGTSDANRNNSDPYYAVFGGRTAPAAQTALFDIQTGTTAIGAPGMAWHEVVITKKGTVVTWHIDNYLLATVDLGEKQIGENIFVGFFDINATQPVFQELSFGLVDNLRVESLEETEPASATITGIQRSGNNVVITFQGTPANGTFTVHGSPTVQGDYTPEAGAVVTQAGQNWQATVPITTSSRFFVIQAE